MNRRERILLIIVSVIVTFVGWYFYLYSPRQAEHVRLTQTLEERRGQLKQMEATALRITQLEQTYRELQSFIAQVEAKLPATKEIPPMLVQLERLTKSLGISLQSIRPGQLETVAPASASQGAPSAQTPAPPAGTSAYFKFPIKLHFEASYAQLLRLTNSLAGFPRLIVIRKITMAPRTLPELNSDMEVETYVLPKEAR